MLEVRKILTSSNEQTTFKGVGKLRYDKLNNAIAKEKNYNDFLCKELGYPRT